MFPTLLSLQDSVREIRTFAESQLKSQPIIPISSTSSSSSPIVITFSAPTSSVVRLLRGLEEALAPDPLCSPGDLLEGFIAPLLASAPRQQRTHAALEETLRQHCPDPIDAFRVWLMYSLQRTDALYASLQLLLAGPVTKKGEENGKEGSRGDGELVHALFMRRERVRRLHECVGSHTPLLQAPYVAALLLLLRGVYYPTEMGLLDEEEEEEEKRGSVERKGVFSGRRVCVRYEMDVLSLLPLLYAAPRTVPVEQLRLHGRPRRRRKIHAHKGQREDYQTPSRDTGLSAVGMQHEGKEKEDPQRRNSDPSPMKRGSEMDAGSDFYYTVVDAATQTVESIAHDDSNNNNNIGSSRFSNNGANDSIQTTPTPHSFPFHPNGRPSIGVNTSHPSPLMTFAELLDAQAQLESLRSSLRLDAAALRQRERCVAELEADYTERLALLTQTLRGVKRLYHDALSSRAAPRESPLAVSEVEKRMRHVLHALSADTPASPPPSVSDAPAVCGVLLFPPVQLPRAVQLARQGHRCANCHAPFGHEKRRHLLPLQRPRRCHYCTRLFCHACHTRRAAMLPFLVLDAWDFGPRRVCERDRAMLRESWAEPWCALAEGEHCLHAAALRDSTRLAHMLRQWFLVCARLLRGCVAQDEKDGGEKDAMASTAPELTAILRSYYAATDGMYSMSDLRGIRCSEESGVASRVLRSGRSWSVSAVGRKPAALVAAVEHVMSAVPFSRLLAFGYNSITGQGNHGAPSNSVHPTTSTVRQGNDNSSSDTVGTGPHETACDGLSEVEEGEIGDEENAHEENVEDFLQFLVTRIQCMEQHLYRDCRVCIARSMSVCELCGDRQEAARIPLIDTDITALQLAEEPNTADGQLARVAVQLIRGKDQMEAMLCRKCGTKYHRTCFLKASCPHCS